MSVDLGEAIDRWRDEFVRTVGMTDPDRGMAKYRHGYHKGEAAQASITAAWQAKATAAEALANANAGPVARLQKAEANLVAEVDRHAHDNLARDARYAQALDGARHAAEAERASRAACKPVGKGEGPAGNAPMTRSMRDALGVLRKGEHQ